MAQKMPLKTFIFYQMLMPVFMSITLFITCPFRDIALTMSMATFMIVFLLQQITFIPLVMDCYKEAQ